MSSSRPSRRVAVAVAATTISIVVAAPLAHAAVATGLRCRSCVESSDIRNSTILGVDVRNGTLTGADVKDGTIGVYDIAAGAVGSDEIVDGSIQPGDLATGAVTSAALAGGAVTSSTIASGAVTSSALASGAVTSSALAGGSVTAAAIAADAVTSSAIATGAVGSGEIADASVATSDLAFDPVTGTELESSIGAFNASRAAQHDITPLSIQTTTETTMFGLQNHNRDGNDDTITVTRDTRLMIEGVVVIERGGVNADPVVCSPWLDSDPYPAALVGASSYASLEAGSYTTVSISGSATVSAGTYDVFVSCRKLTDTGDDSSTIDGNLNVWLAEQ